MSAKGAPGGPSPLTTDLALGEWVALARHAADALAAGADVSYLSVNGGGAA